MQERNAAGALCEGLRFGMLLQLSVGPVCLLVFQTACSGGLASALLLILAVALVDALYIFLAVAGVSAALNSGKGTRMIRLFGGLILILFGVNVICGSLGVSLLPRISLFSGTRPSNLFFQGILLTASNPLTIVFWGGVFSSRVAESASDRAGLFPFGCGCVLATVLFLSGVAVLGRTFGTFLPPGILTVLNLCVGAAITGFGLKMMVPERVRT